MVGPYGCGGHESYFRVLQKMAVASCAGTHYESIGILYHLRVDFGSREQNEFGSGYSSLKKGDITVCNYLHRDYAISDSMSINRKNAMKRERRPQNHMGLCGILRMAKKLEIWTETAKQNDET